MVSVSIAPLTKLCISARPGQFPQLSAASLPDPKVNYLARLPSAAFPALYHVALLAAHVNRGGTDKRQFGAALVCSTREIFGEVWAFD